MNIAIINDQDIVCNYLSCLIEERTEHTVIWIAHDGRGGVELCAIDTPDLILMDLNMPVMNGVEATRRIMESSPCAILLVTASVTANSSRVFEAMGAGALDAVSTPYDTAQRSAQSVSQFLYKIATIEKLIGTGTSGPDATRPIRRKHSHAESQPLIAIGASTGGPAVLAEILRKLPADSEVPIIIVQHVDSLFVEGFTSWLNSQIVPQARTVHVSEYPAPGEVLVAGSEDHLVLNRFGRLEYTPEPRDLFYRPSVDVFFESVARHWGGEAIGILLTGMGQDGAAGLRELREAGHHTIAQNRESCIVYGMPKAAVELDAAMEVLSPEEISRRLRVLTTVKRPELTSSEGGA